MSLICPCCNQNSELTTLSDDDEMKYLRECSNCQSVLRLEGDTLKVVQSMVDSNNQKPPPPPQSEVKEPEVEEPKVVESFSPEIPPSEDTKAESKTPPVDESVDEEPPPPDDEKLQTVETPSLDSEVKEPSEQDFSDVEQYANTSLELKGLWRYDLEISGIDSIDIEKQIISILEDSRLRWSAKELLSHLKDGILVIKNINPVKAMVLISQLMSLPVQCCWKQYIAQSKGDQP